MSDPEQIIPFDRLPEGFAETLDQIPETPAVPRPAATILLLREGGSGVEILLMRRGRQAGFVPGAYVFPGGRVDPDDAAQPLIERVDGLSPSEAASRLDLEGSDPPAIAYYVSALREAFEETGLLPGRTNVPPPAAGDARVERLRDGVMSDRVSFADALDEMGVRLQADAVEYVAHWVTPLVEPRRYDTRFFAAEVAAGSEAVVDPREMVDAVWLTAEQALKRNAEGSLPMVFPTVMSLRDMMGFETPGAVLESYRSREIPVILPRLVKTPTGVGLSLDP